MSTSVIVPLAQVWTSYPIDFFFQNHYCNLIKFSKNTQAYWTNKKILEIQFLPYLKSNFFQSTFIKSYSLKAFKQY
jgi:hypothetical protein